MGGVRRDERVRRWLPQRGWRGGGVYAVALLVAAGPSLSAQQTCDPTVEVAIIQGAVRDAESEVPLPGARVRVEWEGGSAEAHAGSDGHFVVCEVPAGEPLRVSAGVAGFSSRPVELELGAGETHELDLLVGFEARETPGRAGEVVSREVPDLPGRIVGRVVDAESGSPVDGALVAVGDADYQAVTGAEGAFELERVPAGERTLRVHHIAYGEHQASVTALGNATVDLEIRLAAEPIELEPLTVTVTEVRDRRLEIKGFYERKELGERLGLGRYFTWEDVERRNPRLLSEMVADLPSVRLDCRRGFGSRTCEVLSARAPPGCFRMSVTWMEYGCLQEIEPAPTSSWTTWSFPRRWGASKCMWGPRPCPRGSAVRSANAEPS